MKIRKESDVTESRYRLLLEIVQAANSHLDLVRVLEDRWTAVTADGSLAAHFEHTVAVTEHGPDVLTADAREAA